MTHQFLLSRTGCSSLPPCLAPLSISLVSSSHCTALAWLQPGHFPSLAWGPGLLFHQFFHQTLLPFEVKVAFKARQSLRAQRRKMLPFCWSQEKAVTSATCFSDSYVQKYSYFFVPPPSSVQQFHSQPKNVSLSSVLFICHTFGPSPQVSVASENTLLGFVKQSSSALWTSQQQATYKWTNHNQGNLEKHMQHTEKSLVHVWQTKIQLTLLTAFAFEKMQLLC